jgi:ATP-dependent DNA helicase RecQ
MLTQSETPDLDTRLAQLQAVIARHWGFKSLRPLQDAAMKAVLEGRDSLLVLPTGGGKSLCYQAPAMVCEGTTIVVSPLISLMKDQVDSLRTVGISAAALNSSLESSESRQIHQELRQGEIRLLFVSPERLALDGFRQLLHELGVTRFAIDEAHCISHWGHDFRPEYRQLKTLKQQFPKASIHGFTATATPQVRKDIVEQLGIASADVMVGSFDRPNLTFRVVPRSDLYGQVTELIDRHKGEAGIIYCIRRRDVDELTDWLKSNGVAALPYHAGMDAQDRKRVQTAFKQERCDLVVATVAFGMGIDRSNVRYVLHTGMPKSIEHYQQESGRAGRDGLEAECVLLYSAADGVTWKQLMEKSVGDARQPVDPNYLKSAFKHLKDIDAYCRPLRCRHKSLVEYFGQPYNETSCQACDVCLEDANVEDVPDATTVAKKILSCVARVKEGFGVGHVISVLRGENIEAIRKRDHDKLSTFGLLKNHTKNDLRDWIYQLIAKEALLQTSDEFPLLKLNELSWQIMRDQQTITLTRHHKPDKPAKKSRADVVSWEGVDRDLFEALRELRRTFAEERSVPPYVIFNDATLRELARVRPSSIPGMHLVYGVGERKLAEFGEAFLAVIDEHCGQRGLSRDGRAAKASPAVTVQKPSKRRRPNQEQQMAIELFRKGKSVDEVAILTGRALSTVSNYLCEYIREEQPASIETWVLPDVYRLVSNTIDRLQAASLKPVYIALGEQIPYHQISIVMAHKAMGDS